MEKNVNLARIATREGLRQSNGGMEENMIVAKNDNLIRRACLARNKPASPQTMKRYAEIKARDNNCGSGESGIGCSRQVTGVSKGEEDTVLNNTSNNKQHGAMYPVPTQTCTMQNSAGGRNKNE